MSEDHNMNQQITGSLFSAAQVDAIEAQWRDKCQRYIDVHDAVVNDNDRLYELLKWCEVEMRYAGWGTYEADNSGRNGVYEQVLSYLHPPVKGEK